MIGDCEFGVLLYLFSQLLYVFYNVIRKTNGRSKRFVTGNYICQPGGRIACPSILAEVVVATLKEMCIIKVIKPVQPP